MTRNSPGNNTTQRGMGMQGAAVQQQTNDDEECKMADTTATWTVELNCECPACHEYVDVLEYPDFWDGRHLEIAEHGTDRSKDVEVICPNCDHEFTVFCEW